MFTVHNVRIMPDPGTMRRLEWEVDAARYTDRVISPAELDSMLDDAGTVHSADFLYRAVVNGAISDDTLAGIIGNVWQFSYPNGPGRDGWIWMFRKAGYTVNCKSAPLPDKPLRLYRGAPHDNRYGLSWTPSRAGASNYAREAHGMLRRSHPSPVWTADIPPDRLLCRINSTEIEYVADAEGLEVREAGK
jgi:hypothetical protein